MRLIKNAVNDRVVDELRKVLTPRSTLDMATPAFSLFAFAELQDALDGLSCCRLALPVGASDDLGLLGSGADRASRNRLEVRRLAKTCSSWVDRKVEVRDAPANLPQSMYVSGPAEDSAQRATTGRGELDEERIIRSATGIRNTMVWRAALADSPNEDESTSAFLASISVAKLPASDLLSLYQGWVDCVAVLEASRATGISLPPQPEGASVGIDAVLQEHARLLREMAGLRAQAQKETQVARRVDLNLRLKDLAAQVGLLRQRLVMENEQ